MNVQLRVNFQGRVQGVGFRYQTANIARNFDVQGYVQNLSDGTVDLVAEGEKEELEGFLEQIQSQMAGNIVNFHQHWYTASGNFNCFEIKR